MAKIMELSDPHRRIESPRHNLDEVYSIALAAPSTTSRAGE